MKTSYLQNTAWHVWHISIVMKSSMFAGVPTPKIHWDAKLGTIIIVKPNREWIYIPVVPHKAVAEVTKGGNLWERLVVVNQGWQSEATHGSKGDWVFLPIYLSIYRSIYLSIYLSVYRSVCLSVYLSSHLSIYLSISSTQLASLSLFHLITYLSIYLPVYLSLPFICLSV